MTRFKLFCEINAGWASLTFENGKQKDSIFFSHLFDGLESLLDTVIELNLGAQKADCHLFADAESFGFQFDRKENELIVKLFNFTGWMDYMPVADIAEKGLLIFETEISLKAFTNQVIHLFQKLEKTYGRDGYAEKWGNDFPTDKLAQLTSLISRRRIGLFSLLLI